MKVTVRISKHFKAEAKRLIKRYPSLNGDLALLEKELIKTPRTGSSLGNNAYKIRLKIKSKGKGKSGGARVISFVETSVIVISAFTTEEDISVNLLSIYDKGDVETISDKELKDLIAAFKGI
jgi:mRNA-degrading endonuclease RelE of RelBE toxin-antitoxin system